MKFGITLFPQKNRRTSLLVRATLCRERLGNPLKPPRHKVAPTKNKSRRCLKILKAVAGCLLLCGLLPFSLLQAGTPEQMTDWKKRYQEGVVLEKDGKRDEALAVFSKILEEDPGARGSLLMSGLIHIRKGDCGAALPLLQKFQQLEPDHEGGLIAMIKAHQALGNTEQVELFRRKLLSDRSSGKSSRLKLMLSYEREVILQKDGTTISVQENLDESPGRFIWAYVVLDSKNVMQRRLEWTRIKAPGGAQYVLGEPKTERGLTNQYKVHRLFNEQPDYSKARGLALAILNP